MTPRPFAFHSFSRILLFSSSLFALMTDASFADQRDRYESRTYSDSGDRQLPYRLLKPANYDAQKKYPLVLFLHGAGERGDDNWKQLVHGMRDFASDSVMKEYPCFVVAPPCPTGKRWVEVDWSADKHAAPEEISPWLEMSLKVVESLEKEFSIDSNRLYITGLSMGGYGTWDAIQRHPQRFAAAAPICGGGDESQAERLAKLPLWVFHGAKDNVVKPERSRNMIAAIKKAGGSPKYTEYPNAGHNSWSATYSNPEYYKWLFSQQREKK